MHIRLVFSERPELLLGRLQIISANDTISLSPLNRDSADENAVIAAVAGELPPGSYTILWRVSARDGHVLRGTIDFSVDPRGARSSPNPPPFSGATSDEASGDASFAVAGALGSVFVRWLAFASIFLIAGAVVFRIGILPRTVSADSEGFSQIAATNAATIGMFAAVGLLISSLLKLARESSDMPDIAMSSLLFRSIWGLSLFAQTVAAIAAFAAFRIAHRRWELRSGAWRAAAAAALAASIAPAFGGHAIAGARAYIAVPADIVHMLAGSAWLGTLAVIVVVGVPAALKTPDAIRPGARVAALVNAFSPVALLCGGAVFATGIGASVIRLPGIETLWTTPYGIILTMKLFFVLLVFAAGAWNWRRLRPRLTGDDAIAPLRSSASFELVLASVVLVITAVLVALETP